MEPEEFNEGYNAYLDCKGQDENPYPTSLSGSHSAWDRGWLKARDNMGDDPKLMP